jgi:Protein of unknown function (DUF3060)
MKKILIAAISVLAITSPLNAQLGNLGNVGGSTCNNTAKKISGMGNVISVKGYCSVLTVGGSGNVVTVDRAGSIVLTGTGNVVYYKNLNPGAKKGTFVHPKKSVGGTGNVIEWTKGKEPSFGGSDDDE